FRPDPPTRPPRGSGRQGPGRLPIIRKGDFTMSHHYSGPQFGFPRGDPPPDVFDLFAFPPPGAAGTSILIMDVHPSVGFTPRAPPPPNPSPPRPSTTSRWTPTA